MEENKISLNELKGNKNGEIRKANISDLAPAPKEDPNDTAAGQFEKEIGSYLDAAEKRIAKESYDYQVKLREEERENEIQQEISGESGDSEITDQKDSTVYHKKFNVGKTNIDLDEDDAEIEDDINTQQSSKNNASIFDTPKDMTNSDEEYKKSEVANEEKEKTFINPAVASIHKIEKFDPRDFEDPDEDDEDEKEDPEDAVLKSLSKQLRKTLKPVSNVVDLSSFRISKKPISMSNMISNISNKHVSDWVFIASGRVNTMEAFSGAEIQNLDITTYGSRHKYYAYLDMYTMIFNHCVGLKDRTKVIPWLKTFNFFDTDHLFFNIYKATFEKANIIPYQCPECKESFIKETPIQDMVKFRTPEAEALFQKIYERNKRFVEPEYDIDLMQVSDDLVIGIKEPSIWNVLFENTLLPDKTRIKYQNLLGIISYVDSVYYINRKNNELQELEMEIDPDDIVKTAKNRIVRIAKVLYKLSSDQKSVLDRHIQSIMKKHDDVYYVIPECNCPKCKAKIAEKEYTAERILFTRSQLGDIANI